MNEYTYILQFLRSRLEDVFTEQAVVSNVRHRHAMTVVEHIVEVRTASVHFQFIR